MGSGVPLQDALKSPRHPVWVLHAGDHFTLLFSPRPFAAAAVEGSAAAAGSTGIELLHFNGLLPAGPRMAALRVVALRGCAPPAPDSPQQTHFRKEAGEVT